MRLVEREGELGVVNGLFDLLGHGEGALLLVDGPVACGKTEILQAVARRAAQIDALTLTATASALESGFPFAVVAQLIEGIPEDGNSRLSGILSSLKDFDGSAEAQDNPPVNIMVDVYDTLVGLAKTSPVVVIVDDLHHSDAASLALILGLARRAQRRPMLFVLSQQSSCMRGHQLFQTELRRQPHCHYMQLKPLSLRAVGEILAQHLDGEHALRLAPAHSALSGGNPLLLRALLEDYQGGLAVSAAGSLYENSCLVPGEAYRQAVTACLQRGSSDATEVARALAVLHTSQSEHLAGRLLDLGHGTVERLKGVLMGSGLLGEAGFRHPAAREAVLDNAPPVRRTTLHLRAAQLLFDDGVPATAVAGHLLAAGEAQEPWAVGVLTKAAEEVLCEDRAGLAQSYLELALRESGDPNQQAAVTLQLARSVWRRSPDRALRRTLSMVNTFDFRDATESQTIQLIKSLLRHGMFTEAENLLERMDGRVTAQTHAVSDDLKAFRLWLNCSYPVLLQRFPLAPQARAGREGSRAAPAASALLRATTLLYDVLSRNPAPHEIAAPQEELRVLRLSDATLEPLGTALIALIYADWLDSAEQWCKTLLGEATRRGVPAWIGVLSSVMSEIALRRGDLQATEEYARAALTHISAEGWGVAVGSTRGALLTAVTARGDLRAAEALINEPLPERLFDTRDGLHYQHARGRFHLALDNPHAALRDFEACSARMRDWGLDRPTLVPWRTDAAQALLRLERVDEGRALAEEQLGLLGPTHLRVKGATLRVLAATAPPRQRLDLLGQAVHALEPVRDRLELAQALADLSKVHSALGDHTNARHAMIRARQLARACRADALARSFSHRDEEALKDRPSAVRPHEEKPRDLESGDAELTVAERRVAQIVAKGRSNREVASQLFITVSTVEQHLTSIYRKLNINRRSQLRSVYVEMT